MSAPITASLHELVFTMDAHADRELRARFGVDQNLFAFLAPLASGPMDVTRLARSLNLTKAAVSKRVSRLEREGWLAATSDPQHRRRVVLALSPAGTELVRNAAVVLNAQFAAVLAKSGIDEPGFNAQLRSLIDAVRALAESDR